MVDRAWLAVRIVPLLFALTAGGCSMSEFLPNWSGDDIAGPVPAHREIIAPRINSIVGNLGAGRLYISEPRRVDSLKGASWLVCLQIETAPMPRHYAVFLQRERIVDSRLSVVIDQCEQQPYTAFDWTAEARPRLAR